MPNGGSICCNHYANVDVGAPGVRSSIHLWRRRCSAGGCPITALRHRRLREVRASHLLLKYTTSPKGKTLRSAPRSVTIQSVGGGDCNLGNVP